MNEPNNPLRTHHLKTWPYSFESVLAGTKRAEYRKLWDRDFAVGDALILQEFRPEEQTYTGREIGPLIITEITTGYQIPEGYGMLSFIPQGLKVEPNKLSTDDRPMIDRQSEDGRVFIVWNVGVGFYLASNKEDGGLRHWTANKEFAETFSRDEAQNLLDFGEVLDEAGKLYKIKDIGAIILGAVGR